MTADQYLTNILIREAVDTGPQSRVRGVIVTLLPLIQRWAGQYLLDVQASGSFAKGTANKSGTDLDIFISVSPSNPLTLGATYENLFQFLAANGYQPKRQNVSININSGGYSVDLVPGQRQNHYSLDHSLWRRRANTWTKTNVDAHINYVRAGGRINETRILKLWRNQHGLDFPSFYLELTVIEALRGYSGTFSQNVWRVFQYLQTTFETARVVDPANTNNVISDDLALAEKGKIKFTAGRSLAAKTWEDIVK
jgi:hypothetical protein